LNQNRSEKTETIQRKRNHAFVGRGVNGGGCSPTTASGKTDYDGTERGRQSLLREKQDAREKNNDALKKRIETLHSRKKKRGLTLKKQGGGIRSLTDFLG